MAILYGGMVVHEIIISFAHDQRDVAARVIDNDSISAKRVAEAVSSSSYREAAVRFLS